MERTSLSNLVDYFNNLELYKLKPNSAKEVTEIHLEVFYCNTSLYKFNGSSQRLELTCPNEIRHDVIEVIDRAGIYIL
jgi:hypothetical protein